MAGELAKFDANQDLAPYAHYWRGFALWRRAVNGFNAPIATKEELEGDLQAAIREFSD